MVISSLELMCVRGSWKLERVDADVDRRGLGKPLGVARYIWNIIMPIRVLSRDTDHGTLPRTVPSHLSLYALLFSEFMYIT